MLNFKSLTIIIALSFALSSSAFADVTLTQRMTTNAMPTGTTAIESLPQSKRPVATGKPKFPANTQKPIPRVAKTGAVAIKPPVSPKAPIESNGTENVLQVKGTLMRSVRGTTVTLTNLVTDEVTILDTRSKTFAKIGGGKSRTGMPDLSAMMDTVITGDIIPVGSLVDIDGRPMQEFMGKVVMSISPKAGLPFPGIGSGQQLDSGVGPLFSLTFAIQAKSTSKVNVDPSIMGKLGLQLIQQMTGSIPGAGALRKKIEQISGVVLYSKMKMTIQSALPIPGLSDKPITIITETLKVDETELDPVLFKIPADYTEAEPGAIKPGRLNIFP